MKAEIGTGTERVVGGAFAEAGGGPDGPAALLTWLATDVMLLTFDLAAEAEPVVELTVDGESAEVEVRHLSPYAEEGGDAAITLLTGWVAKPVVGKTLELVVRVGDEEIRLGPGLAPAVAVDLRTTIREKLAGREADARGQILGFLTAAPAEHSHTLDPLGLSKSLFALREALRDPYPQVELRADESQGLHIGAVARVDERTFFVRGWARDDQAPIVRLDAVSPEGSRASILERLFRVPRPDLEELFRSAPRPVPKPGFVSFFELEHPSRLAEGWVFELENSAGVGIEAGAPAATVDPLAVRDTILGELARERRVDTPLMEQLAPAVVRLQEELAGRVDIEEVDEFGVLPGAAEVSVVIPLYRRVDLIEHQLAQFANDPSMLEAEIVFVLDSPELASEFLPRVAELHELYRVPFRLATLSRNGGFAVASNRGASIAGGRLLLLLNSDVLPARPEWLPELAAAYDAQPEAGAVAPKLLFDDGSIQHAGMDFRRNPATGGWELAHRFKGLHRGFAGAGERGPVASLSGACLLTERALYEDLGGFSADYVKGGYEDADLCMRLQERELETWYVPEVELYHLEGRSYVPSSTDMSNRFNAWLFDQRWGERVAGLVADGRGT
ncbi:MAG TPA: glycosyltransferase [Solirubrobacterales bacterium]|nr:glycosyltransferase [Solirubrobacterales bacterium]